MAPPDVKVAQVAYRNHPEITMSDHQPVSADFDISVRARGDTQGGFGCLPEVWCLQLALIDRSQYETSVLALQRELAGFETSERRPKIKIQPVSIDFGVIQ